MLLIDHNMALIMEVCDRIHVLDQGRTLAEGTPQEIRGNLDVTAAYLGESAVHEGPDERGAACARARRPLRSTTAPSRPCGTSRSRSARARSSA